MAGGRRGRDASNGRRRRRLLLERLWRMVEVAAELYFAAFGASWSQPACSGGRGVAAVVGGGCGLASTLLRADQRPTRNPGSEAIGAARMASRRFSNCSVSSRCRVVTAAGGRCGRCGRFAGGGGWWASSSCGVVHDRAVRRVDGRRREAAVHDLRLPRVPFWEPV